MLFSSITFLYYFLPVTLLLYFMAPKDMKNTVLLAASLIFYAWGEPAYVLFMIVSIIVGYGAGCWIEIFYKQKYAKYILSGAVLIHLAGLIYFKYTDFLIRNIGRLSGTDIPLLNVVMPIGISFYTFQILSYEIDVYRGIVPAQKSFLKLAAYVAMFPQLIAGPIVRYTHVNAQLEERSFGYEAAAAGTRRFILGLGKKVLIANTLGELCEIFKVSDDKAVVYFWLYGIAVTLYIYFDFSGYSDMAIGLGRILGFDFPENFDYPYISKSVTEFWRRWHISLGQWFRDYVYIPMGGNRGTKIRWLFNILTVWMLTGLWHGAEWNFVFWGLYFAVFLIIEKSGLLQCLDRYGILRHMYLGLVIIPGFVLFNASGLKEGITYIGAMFGMGNYPVISSECIYYLRSYAVILFAAIVGATPCVKTVAEKIEKKMGILEPVFLVLIMVMSTACLVDGSFNPFLYFRF